MKHRTLPPDAGEVVLDQLMVEGNCRLVMVLRAAGEAGCCPECRRESGRIHSHYKRRLKDLPWEGIPVRIELRVRRFFCGTENCGQQIFTERLPNTVQRYGRRTCRLSASLEQITLALGGSAGSRLARQLGILASGSTLLRQLRRNAIMSPAHAPRVLGIGYWAWRKGHRYGTILCGLERGNVVDLLPDRSSESTAQWLRAHPGTEIISRDRASLYAEAATAAAPQAVQIADRWHLLHNLNEALIGALLPHHRLLAEVSWPRQARQRRLPLRRFWLLPWPSRYLDTVKSSSIIVNVASKAIKQLWSKSRKASPSAKLPRGAAWAYGRFASRESSSTRRGLEAKIPGKVSGCTYTGHD